MVMVDAVTELAKRNWSCHRGLSRGSGPSQNIGPRRGGGPSRGSGSGRAPGLRGFRPQLSGLAGCHVAAVACDAAVWRVTLFG